MISNALATVNKPGTHRVEAALYLTSFRDRAHAECASLERFVSGAIMFALTLCSNDVMPLECRSNVGAPNCKNFGFLSYVLTSLRRHCSMCDQFFANRLDRIVLQTFYPQTIAHMFNADTSETILANPIAQKLIASRSKRRQ